MQKAPTILALLLGITKCIFLASGLSIGVCVIGSHSLMVCETLHWRGVSAKHELVYFEAETYMMETIPFQRITTCFLASLSNCGSSHPEQLLFAMPMMIPL
jgi:hypothetical protein